MTLLDDLQSINLSGIIDAKTSISLAVGDQTLQALVDDGAAQRVLGGLGEAVASARQGLEDPAALLEPLGQALGALAEEISPGDLPLGEYVDAVTAAARLVTELLGGLQGNPGAMGLGGGGSFADVLSTIGGPLGDYAAVAVGEVGKFRFLLDTMERGAPSDPSALGRLVLEVVLPFSQEPLRLVRAQVDALLADMDRLALDPRLVEGLVAATLRVEAAVQAGDAAQVRAAVDGLDRIRSATVEQLADGLRRVVSVLSGLRLDVVLGPLTEIAAALRSAEAGAIETLAEWRAQIVQVRELIEEVDIAVAMGHIENLLGFVEQEARARIVPEFDRLVGELEAWLRGLFRELPLRSLRHQLSQGIRSVADAIAGADLDVVVDAIREALAFLESLLEQADLGAMVVDATAQIEAAVESALDEIASALSVVTGEVEAVADTAAEILGRAVDGITAFRGAVDAVTVALDEAGIQQATDDIVSSLAALRQTAEELLSAVPIPDALRGTIEQLASTLESVDLDQVIGEPMRAVAAELRLPDDVEEGITGGLEAIAGVLDNLIPTNLTAELEAAIGDALSEITNLDVAPLTAGITAVLDDAATFLDGISIADAVEPAAAAFDEVLEAVDRLHPRVLLGPVIEVYDRSVGAISIPDPDTITTRTAEVTAAAGEAVARSTTEPVRRAAGSGATLAPAGGASRADAANPGPRPDLPPDDLRPGDVIRMIGYLPGLLREAIGELDAGPVGEVMDQVDALCGGLAGDLALVRDRVPAIDHVVQEALDTTLAPLAQAQIRAQVALHAHVSTPGAQIDLQGSMDVMAGIGPAALRQELAGELDLVRAGADGVLTSMASSLAADLDDAVELLRGCPLGRIGADLDAFLAALDPEPVAAEFDAMLAVIVGRAPAFIAAARDQLTGLEARVTALVREFNPGTQAQKYLRVLGVLKEELDLVDPGRLADELAEVHGAIRAGIAAYDPRALATELDGLVARVAAAVRQLDPANLLPDLSGLRDQVARVAGLVPTQALDGIGTQLAAVGAELRDLDVEGLLATVNGLAPAVTQAVVELVEAVQSEIVALLRAIRYAGASASASVEVSVG